MTRPNLKKEACTSNLDAHDKAELKEARTGNLDVHDKAELEERSTYQQS